MDLGFTREKFIPLAYHVLEISVCHRLLAIKLSIQCFQQNLAKFTARILSTHEDLPTLARDLAFNDFLSLLIKS